MANKSHHSAMYTSYKRRLTETATICRMPWENLPFDKQGIPTKLCHCHDLTEVILIVILFPT
jgi:hypothetical protein